MLLNNPYNNSMEMNVKNEIKKFLIIAFLNAFIRLKFLKFSHNIIVGIDITNGGNKSNKLRIPPPSILNSVAKTNIIYIVSKMNANLKI